MDGVRDPSASIAVWGAKSTDVGERPLIGKLKAGRIGPGVGQKRSSDGRPVWRDMAIDRPVNDMRVYPYVFGEPVFASSE